MSLARVALALVCAASLDSACAIPVEKFAPWPREEFYFGLCHTEHIGYRTRKSFTLPEQLIPSRHEAHDLVITNLCKPKKMELVGVVVTVCDTDTQPDVTLTSVAHGTVRRPGMPMSAASCYIKEYCN